MNADRLMRNMMQSMGMGMPFGTMFGDISGSTMHPPPMGPSMTNMVLHGGNGVGFLGDPMSMMMMDPFQSMQQAMSMTQNGGGPGFSYCSSSVTSYTTDEHGRPQVFQQSNEVKQGPNGLKETKSAVRDSRTGHQELAIGHHLKEKAYIKKKSKNAYTGEEEQCEDLVGLEEDEAETFERNWQQEARNVTQYNNQIQYNSHRPTSSRNRLALTSSAYEDGGHGSSHDYHYQSPKSHKPSTYSSLIEKVAMKTKKKKKNKEPKA